MKYLGISLPKKVKDLYSERKGIEERNWRWQQTKIFGARELEESILLKCSYYAKQYTDSMQYQWHFQQN